MSNRRKDMWKLLYSLVNRSESDLNVFTFVDDILCKEPSLIRPNSLSEVNNRFQDTFMLWLINKFVSCLGEHRSQEMQLNNIKLQQKILSSCLVNCTVLFERLVAGYAAAIKQLADQQSELELAEEECEGQVLEISAFCSQDTCLQEIDPDFSFQVIRVPIDDVDEHLQALLQILRHALSIGYDVYPSLFVANVESLVAALRECDLSTKILCLRYFHQLYQAAHQMTPLLIRYYVFTVRAIAHICEYLAVWLRANCLEKHEVQSLLDILIDLLDVGAPHFIKASNCRAQLFPFAFQILHNVVGIAQDAHHQSLCDFGRFIKSLIEFILRLQLQPGKMELLSEQKCLFVLRLANKYPALLRVIAANVVHQDLSASLYILEHLKKKMIDLLEKCELGKSDVESLKELLSALIFLEHQQIQRNQVTLMKAQKNRDSIGTLPYTLRFTTDVFSHINTDSGNWAVVLNAKVDNFLLNAGKVQDLDLLCERIKIIGLLLDCATVRNLLGVQQLQKLVEFLEKPVKVALVTTRTSNSNERELANISMRTLSNIYAVEPSELGSLLRSILKTIGSQLFGASSSTHAASAVTDDLRLIFCQNLHNLIVSGLVSREQIARDYITSRSLDSDMLACMLKSVYCTSDLQSCHAFLQSPYAAVNYDKTKKCAKIEFVCAQCEHTCQNLGDILSYMQEHSLVLLQPCQLLRDSCNSKLPNLPPTMRNTICNALCKDEKYSFIGNHLELASIAAQDILEVLRDTEDITLLKFHVLHAVLPKFIAADSNFLSSISQFVLQCTVLSLQPRQKSKNLQEQKEQHQKQEQEQCRVLMLIDCCAHSDASEQWLFHFFKMTFFYLVHPNSRVVQEAILCATEMCAKHGVQPSQLWNWYKRDALKLLIKLAVNVYLRKGERLTRSLKAFTKMLGFSCVQEFICKYSRLLTTMILPYCVKEPLCKGLIVSIAKITRKSVSTLFAASFLRIYAHIYLTEEPAIGNKCIELIVRCTDSSLSKLMNTDVKQTVSEFLIYFNRNPKFVMQAFQCLLLNEGSVLERRSTSELSSKTNEFSKFIADRFLGVITYFETCLAEPNFEKSLKEEALYSLAQIIRFVGGNHVTQFRFKIIAMLSFVLSLNDRHLQSICLKIWNIFLRIVNTQQLGPSLSRIVASLQPLLQHSAAEVNAIYEFMILKNDSLLGSYVPDLYFVENNVLVAPAIRQCVARQTDILKSDKSPLRDKFEFFFKQIANEHLQVRIYGLEHLRSFIATQRFAINHMVLGELKIDPLIENVLDILVAGCRHEDRNLQLASAKCLGELGAIDPSYMLTNYSGQQTGPLALSIHTDDFAIMALTELCRAYQFQKITKYVDNFSLAIQETLSVCGVSPKENKKLNVWEAIPVRMRPVMEPLLSSCYTGSKRESKCKEHPIFNSSYCRSYEDWAFAWASRLIDFVHTEETKHLLNSYKPSIKRDNNTLALFFPYIVLHSLQECNEAQLQQIYEEFAAVFSFSNSGANVQPETYAKDTVGFKEFLSTKYSVDRSGDADRKATALEQYDALENNATTCIKLCSEQIDFLQRWVREWQRVNIIGGKVSESGDIYKSIDGFVEKFDKLSIAKANYDSGEFARALLYLEEYIEQDAKLHLQEQISFLIQIHGSLMDSDSVEGAVFMKQSNLNLTEEILVNRIVDRPQETMTCYEQLMSSHEQINQQHIKGMINCYLRMETPETALLITDGLWQKLTDQYTDDYFKECKSELLWRLGRYDELQELLEDSVVRRKTTNWNIQCAEAFLLFGQSQEQHENAYERFVELLDAIRSSVLCTMRNCTGVKQNSYPHLYDEVVKLHLLNEVERNRLLLNHMSACFVADASAGGDKCVDEVRRFFADWDARLCVLQPTVRVMEPVLCFQRNLLIETKRLMSQNMSGNQATALRKEIGDMIDTEIGKLWIRSVQMHRDAGSLQQAHISIMKAEQYEPKTLFIEKAKFLWEKGDQTNSFKLIAENLERIEGKCERNIRDLDAVDRALYAEAKFLQATYNAESMNICAELNLRYFKEAISGNRQSEKCYVQLAQYMEKIYESFSKQQKDGENGLKLLLDIMVNYVKSLKCGFENVYQSLPRLLSLWLDFTSQSASITDTVAGDVALANKAAIFQELSKKMNDLINNCSTVLPASTFYTAFSQLLSRLCHPSPEVFSVLRTIVIKLIEHFPHQSLWMLLPVLKSSHTNRIKRCKLIFTDARLAKPQFQKLLSDFNMLAERLIELTNKDVALDTTHELQELVPQLSKLFQDPNFSDILLPFEKYMQPSFPIPSSGSLLLPKGSQDNLNNSATIPKNPFPYSQIFISGINETVTVLRSAAKPKKITIQCSDGKQYEVMVKPKDDLRKDFRLMEFNGLVKRYLHQDPQARQRRLRIRTYAAIPFNDECGLVEWLPKLNSFRSICSGIYRTRGLGIPDRMLRQCALPKHESIEKKRQIFLKKLLPHHPPVFHEWFRQRFPTPHSWYEARGAYLKTMAVMSMVGYILGLGDRHGENVLFDEHSGEAVHVDFNCLFNQGETFAFPELVPFRLTHNLVFAMGPLGVEGRYRKCCEITLRVLKDETKTLMSVLRPFVYDLVVLNRNNKKQTAAELTDPKAMVDVRRIEERLQGYVKKTLANSMPLSTEGQVNFLINEARDIDNLAAMYIGWGSYI